MRIINKKALHNYHILEHLEAGIVLSGAEVKSIRNGRIDLGESYVKILDTEAFLVNANIPRYNQAADKEYDATKSRKLLLHRDQINSLIGKVSGKATTLVPISIYEKNNKFKVEVGLAKSKKEFDKREDLKHKEARREMDRAMKK